MCVCVCVCACDSALCMLHCVGVTVCKCGKKISKLKDLHEDLEALQACACNLAWEKSPILCEMSRLLCVRMPVDSVLRCVVLCCSVMFCVAV